MCRPLGFGAYAAITAILIFLATVADANTCPAKQDLTLKQRTKGAEVVEAAIEKVQEVIPDNTQFLRRIAYVESIDGEQKDTYRAGYHGGIWQVDEIGFQDTQNTTSHPDLVAKFARIERVFGIYWITVTWEDLEKPFYSALAARLFLSNIEEAIPSSSEIEEQAEYWNTYYNTDDGKGTVQDFIDRVNELNDKIDRG